MQQVVSLVTALARLGLPGVAPDDDDLAREPWEPLDDDRWQALLRAVAKERLMPQLWRALMDGAFAATGSQTHEARHLAHLDSCRVLALEALLVEVLDHLAAAGIDNRVLKGPSVARLDYPDPSMRSFVDVDVLIPGNRLDAAVRMLEDAGHTRYLPELAPGFDGRFGKGTTLRSPDNLEIDLHRSFDRGPFGIRVQLDDLWASAESFELGGRRLLALAAEERFLSVCFHAALSDIPPRLVPLRDVAQIAANGLLDFDRLEQLVRSWRCAAVVGRAVTLASDLLRVTFPPPLTTFADPHRISARDARLIGLYVDERRSHAARSVAIVRFVPGMRNKVAYLRAIMLPSKPYRATFAQTRLSRLRRSLEPWRYRRGEQGLGEPEHEQLRRLEHDDASERVHGRPR